MRYSAARRRTADAALHLVYVRELLLKGQLLAAGDCHMCQNSPRYYAVAAIFLRVAEWTHAKDTFALQCLSLLFRAAGKATAALILRHFLSYAPMQRTGSSVHYLGLAFSALIILGSIYYFLPKPA